MTYDAADNIDADDRSYDYDYDHDNRLTKVTFTGNGGPAEVAHYEYDALGRMISSLSRFPEPSNPTATFDPIQPRTECLLGQRLGQPICGRGIRG